MVQFCYLRLYLGIETVSCRCFATDGMDGHELNLKKMGQPFEVLMLMPPKITPKKFTLQEHLVFG